MMRRPRTALIPAAVAAAVAVALSSPTMTQRAAAQEGIFVGTVEKVDADAGTLSIRDGQGVVRNFAGAKGAGIDLSGYRSGDRVAVTVGRPTPPNMISAADTLRKGDRVEKLAY